MSLGEKTKINVPLSAAAAGLLAWLLYLSGMMFQIKEDVAVIKATVAPAALKVAGNP